MLTLIRMRMQQKPQCRTIIGLLTTCGYTEISHQAYAQHVGWVMGGVAPNQTLDPTNGITMACLVAGMAQWEAGKENGQWRGISFNTKQLLDGIAIAYGQKDIPLGDPNFASQFLSQRVDLGEYGRQAVVVYPGTPGYVSPNPARPDVNHDIYSIPAPSSQPTSSTNDPEASALPTNPAATGNTGGFSAATIVANPGVVGAGEKMLVSWSSVGMRVGSCVAQTSNGETIGRDEQGAQRFNVPASYASGNAFALTLTCESSNGDRVVREVSVLIP